MVNSYGDISIDENVIASVSSKTRKIELIKNSDFSNFDRGGCFAIQNYICPQPGKPKSPQYEESLCCPLKM